MSVRAGRPLIIRTVVISRRGGGEEEDRVWSGSNKVADGYWSVVELRIRLERGGGCLEA